MKAQKVHARSTRLLNNAGMLFPECYASAKLLDLRRSYLLVTSDHSKVTCKRCEAALGKRYREVLGW